MNLPYPKYRTKVNTEVKSIKNGSLPIRITANHSEKRLQNALVSISVASDSTCPRKRIPRV